LAILGGAAGVMALWILIAAIVTAVEEESGVGAVIGGVFVGLLLGTFLGVIAAASPWRSAPPRSAARV
jgi:hypothetical protein